MNNTQTRMINISHMRRSYNYKKMILTPFFPSSKIIDLTNSWFLIKGDKILKFLKEEFLKRKLPLSQNYAIVCWSGNTYMRSCVSLISIYVWMCRSLPLVVWYICPWFVRRIIFSPAKLIKYWLVISDTLRGPASPFGSAKTRRNTI